MAQMKRKLRRKRRQRELHPLKREMLSQSDLNPLKRRSSSQKSLRRTNLGGSLDSVQKVKNHKLRQNLPNRNP